MPSVKGADMVDDVVFIVTALTQEATLSVISGNLAPQVYQVKAGLTMTRANMSVGKQTFSLQRGGISVLSGDSGLEVTSIPLINNFNSECPEIHQFALFTLACAQSTPAVSKQTPCLTLLSLRPPI